MAEQRKMTTYEKLMVVQTSLVAPKGQYNSFGKYKYRSCEDILEALKPLLSKVKAAVVLKDEVMYIGTRVYVKAEATFYDAESDTYIVNSGWAREPEAKKGVDESQITGMASSYARKYALNGLFCIDDNKDADTDEVQNLANNAPKTVEKKADEVKVQQAHIAHLKAECDRVGYTLEKLAAVYKKAKIEDLTMAEYMNAVGRFKQTPSKGA